MYLKKQGTALISSVIILSLVSIIGCFMFKMARNNNELSSMYNFDKDIYDMDEKEEKALNKFMSDINKEIKKDSQDVETFSRDFKMVTDSNMLKYNKNNEELLLITNRNDNFIRERQIKYMFKNEKLMLIPTFKFQDSKA